MSYESSAYNPNITLTSYISRYGRAAHRPWPQTLSRLQKAWRLDSLRMGAGAHTFTKLPSLAASADATPRPQRPRRGATQRLAARTLDAGSGSEMPCSAGAAAPPARHRHLTCHGCLA